MHLEFATATGQRLPRGVRAALVPLARRLAPARLRVQVIAADAALLRRLNRRYRDRDGATDVLAFRYESRPAAAGADAEVYVSLPRAAAQARARGHALRQEFVVLVVHGLLHLQGHDHDRPAAARRMRAAEARHLSWLARRRPGWRARPLVPAAAPARR